MMAIASFAWAPTAGAAETKSSSCEVSSLLSGGFLWAKQDYDYSAGNLGGKDNAFDDKDYSAGNGDAAGLVNCGTTNFQVDMAYYGHQMDYVLGDKDAANVHFGGAMFARGDSGIIGVSGSYVNTNQVAGLEEDIGRGGIVTQFYAHDNFTVGASVHYFNGKLDIKDSSGGHDGMEYSAFAKLYATENLALRIQGDVIDSQWDNSFDTFGWATSAEAEYQINGYPVSVYAGGRYASRDIDELTKIKDTQGYLGVKFAIGGNTTSLLSRDRNGPIDNTSTFLEKLPNEITSAYGAVGEPN